MDREGTGIMLSIRSPRRTRTTKDINILVEKRRKISIRKIGSRTLKKASRLLPVR
jgi:hypothetical protein